MKTLYKISSLLVVLSLIVGCTSTKSIQKNLNAQAYSMAYLKDSRIAEIKSGVRVDIDPVLFSPNMLSDTTKVTRDKGWFLPLVVVYIWKSQNTCIQGKSMFEEDIPTFLRASLMDEINRSAGFTADTIGGTEYTLELSIDELKTVGSYESKGFSYFALYAYGYSYADIAGPAISNLTVSYRLKRNGEVVHGNTFISERATEQINRRYMDIKTLQYDYATSMVEAVSNNLKTVIELIVKDLNGYFSSNT